MAAQNKGRWQTIVTVSMGLLLGVGVFTWITHLPPTSEQPASTDSHYDQRLIKLEQAVMALTQAVQSNQTKAARPEPTQVTAPASSAVSRQELAQVIREEVRNAVAQESPEAQRAKEEAIAEAKVLNSPENKAAYQSASSVVNTAVAAKRWTEEDKETFRAAFGLLTNTQRMELMNILAPAINNGEVKVEVMGPLF
jgi:sRNA-binding carbon storage regulator CsrA